MLSETCRRNKITILANIDQQHNYIANNYMSFENNKNMQQGLIMLSVTQTNCFYYSSLYLKHGDLSSSCFILLFLFRNWLL